MEEAALRRLQARTYRLVAFLVGLFLWAYVFDFILIGIGAERLEPDGWRLGLGGRFDLEPKYKFIFLGVILIPARRWPIEKHTDELLAFVRIADIGCRHLNARARAGLERTAWACSIGSCLALFWALQASMPNESGFAPGHADWTLPWASGAGMFAFLSLMPLVPGVGSAHVRLGPSGGFGFTRLEELYLKISHEDLSFQRRALLLISLLAWSAIALGVLADPDDTLRSLFVGCWLAVFAGFLAHALLRSSRRENELYQLRRSIQREQHAAALAMSHGQLSPNRT